MTRPTLTATVLSERLGAPTLVLGPSLGTSVLALWSPAIPALAEHFTLIGWDLPGHGASAPSAEPFTMSELADAVAGVVRDQRALGAIAWGAPVYYAGVSIAGAVGLHLGLQAPDLFAGLAIVCSAARLGEPDAWHERAALVASAGTPTMVIGSAQRWFAPGFIESNPDVSAALLHSLQDADRHAYAHACGALAEYDVRDRLHEILTPVIAIAGELDSVCPPERAEEVAAGVATGSWAVVSGVAHQAPAESPAETAALLVEAFAGPAAVDVEREGADPYDAGMTVRREVLGEAHVDRATSGITDFTRDYQELITRFAWGTIWTRPGLARTTRSAVTLTALVAGGYWEELEMHVKAARRNGMSVEEIKEVLLQTAIYCSVPAANNAFAAASRALREAD